MKILSVDDSSVVRKIIKSAAQVLGYDFAEAENGVDALSFLEDNYRDIGLILLDWNMPQITGYDVLVALKNDARFAPIPVMMVTTESEKKNIIAAIKAGAANYLTKPFNMQELTTKIMECTD